jgi:threonine/homoserine/homoserine lactone efflux protein
MSDRRADRPADLRADTMELGFLFKGLVIGFSVAAPIGPIGVLCIRRTLAGSFVSGVTSGLGAAAADAVYGSVAAFGLTAVASFLVGQRLVLGLAGGALLCLLGYRVFVSGAARGPGDAGRTAPAKSPDMWRGFLSTFFLTITNPMPILFFIAIFAGAGLAAPDDYFSAGSLVVGVFAGSALWWLILCAGTDLFRQMISDRTMRIINYLAGVVIAGFGVYSIVCVL